MKEIYGIIKNLANNLSDFKSERLHKLLSPKPEGMLEDIVVLIEDFNNYIEWNNNIPTPVKGVLLSYD